MEVRGQRHHDPAALPPGNEPLVPVGKEAVWAPKRPDAVANRKIPSANKKRTSVEFRPVIEMHANRTLNHTEDLFRYQSSVV